MSTSDLTPVSLSRELLDRRRELREEAQRLISEKREIIREQEAWRGQGRDSPGAEYLEP